jgi:hypothetical protein
MDAETEDLLIQAGLQPSHVSCSHCGEPMWKYPAGNLFGNVCVPCGRTYCNRCIQVGGPTPCPECGRPTAPAGQAELMQMGISL